MAVQHIALFQFKPAADISQFFGELERLTRLIPGITGFSHGPNNSPEGLSRGLTHGFIMSFTDAAARDAYLVHPEHKKFVEFALPQIENVVVFDFAT